MATQELKDNQGHVLGRIQQVGPIQEIRDAQGHLKGSFDTRSNETRDNQGRLIGKGNLLATLLK
jgi:YD repeat-containing protein